MSIGDCRDVGVLSTQMGKSTGHLSTPVTNIYKFKLYFGKYKNESL